MGSLGFIMTEGDLVPCTHSSPSRSIDNRKPREKKNNLQINGNIFPEFLNKVLLCLFLYVQNDEDNIRSNNNNFLPHYIVIHTVLGTLE